MTLQELDELLAASEGRWSIIAGPAFADSIVVNHVEPTPWLNVASHTHSYVYTDDVGVTMKLGLRVSPKDALQAVWMKNLDRARGIELYLDVFFQGALVRRWIAVAVDDRCLLPKPPRADEPTADRVTHALFRALAAANDRVDAFDDCFRRCGFRVL